MKSQRRNMQKRKNSMRKRNRKNSQKGGEWKWPWETDAPDTEVSPGEEQGKKTKQYFDDKYQTKPTLRSSIPNQNPNNYYLSNMPIEAQFTGEPGSDEAQSTVELKQTPLSSGPKRNPVNIKTRNGGANTKGRKSKKQRRSNKKR